MKPNVTIVLAMSLAGCTTDWSHNVYEGVRQRQQSVPDPATTQPVTAPDYEQYKRERDALKSTPAP
jgi:hypothetical protein